MYNGNMTKNLLSILAILCLLAVLVSGCTKQDVEENELIEETPTQQEELIEENNNDEDISSKFVVEDNAPYETEVLGEQVESNGQALPDGLVGTWTAVSGIPEGLTVYSLTISPDGYTTQYTVAGDGVSSSYDAYTVATNNGYTIMDAGGSTLMNLNYSDGSLTTYGLTGSETVFQKS